MFISHRIHEEQIKKSAQSLKALYQIRNTGSATTESSGLAGTAGHQTGEIPLQLR